MNAIALDLGGSCAILGPPLHAYMGRRAWPFAKCRMATLAMPLPSAEGLELRSLGAIAGGGDENFAGDAVVDLHSVLLS